LSSHGTAGCWESSKARSRECCSGGSRGWVASGTIRCLYPMDTRLPSGSCLPKSKTPSATAAVLWRASNSGLRGNLLCRKPPGFPAKRRPTPTRWSPAALRRCRTPPG
jgi:hypothetical protein